jgi:hypothetical protein
LSQTPPHVKVFVLATRCAPRRSGVLLAAPR